MKIYDLRAFNIGKITEIIKGYRDCKIILTSWQYSNLPLHIKQLCLYRDILIELENNLDNNGISNLDFGSQENEWNGFSTTPFSVSTTSLGNFWINEGYKNLPTNVFFNDKKKATTLMFDDETTVVKCGKGDEYSRRVGFLEAYFQATCGLSKTQAKKYLDKIVKDKVVKDKEVKDEVKKK